MENVDLANSSWEAYEKRKFPIRLTDFAVCVSLFFCACGSNCPTPAEIIEPEVIVVDDSSSKERSKNDWEKQREKEKAERVAKRAQLKAKLDLSIAGGGFPGLSGLVEELSFCWTVDFDPDDTLNEYGYLRFADPSFRLRMLSFRHSDPGMEAMLIAARLKAEGSNPDDLHRLAQLYNELRDAIDFMIDALREQHIRKLPEQSPKAKELEEKVALLQKKAVAAAEASGKALVKAYTEFPDYEKRSGIVFFMAYNSYYLATHPTTVVTQREQLVEKWLEKTEEYLAMSPDGKFAGNALYLKAEWRRTVEDDLEGAVAFYKQALEKTFSNSTVSFWTRIRLAEALVITEDHEGALEQYRITRKEQDSPRSDESEMMCASLVQSAQFMADNVRDNRNP